MEVVNIDANGKVIEDLSTANIPNEVFELINKTIIDSVLKARKTNELERNKEAEKCVNKD